MKSFFLMLLFFAAINGYPQSIGINEDGSKPNTSAMLDVKSSTKGMLLPRMTSAQRTAIASPVKGLLVFDITTNSFWFYTGTLWTNLSAGSSGYWSPSGTNIFNSNAGNVGIGTSTPVYPLTIHTPINATGWVHVGGEDSIIIGEAVGGVSAAIGTFSNHALRLVAGPGSGKISIYPSGQVVVGDNTVGAVGMLTVKTLNNSDGISHIGENGNILKTIMGGTSAGIGTFSHTNMRIFSGGFSRMLIAEATGNVGIGTDNPTYKLSVVGNVRCTEAVVETGWADYVFDESYPLSSLDELEKYISENKHLPNIPSAAEVEKNGLPLGETQKKMMAKIEELTLYLIAANKRIEKLEELIKTRN